MTDDGIARPVAVKLADTRSDDQGYRERRQSAHRMYHA